MSKPKLKYPQTQITIHRHPCYQSDDVKITNHRAICRSSAKFPAASKEDRKSKFDTRLGIFPLGTTTRFN